MGKEAYGLVGVFAILQILFQVLDVGLSQTLVREIACYRGGASTVDELNHLVRAMKVFLTTGAILAAACVIVAAPKIASDWLRIQNLDIDQVTLAVRLMAGIAGLKLSSATYRSVITGAEDQVWLNGFVAISNTFRYVCVLPILERFGATPGIFFSYQLGLALLEVGVLAGRAHAIVPDVDAARRWYRINWWSLRRIGRFATAVALTSTIWIAITYLDRLLLSRMLPLSEFGFYSVAMTAASSVTLIAIPLSSALLPRMAKLSSEKQETELLQLYRIFTRLASSLAFSVAIILVFSSKEILFLWTNNLDLANYGSVPAAIYALGNAIFVAAAFPYYLQYSKGDLRLHLWGICLFVILYVPAVVWLIFSFSTVGAACAWTGANLLYLIVWVPIVHHRFAPGIHINWLFRDVLMPACTMAVVGAIFYVIPFESASRLAALVHLSFKVVLILGAGCICSGAKRTIVRLIPRREPIFKK